MQRFINALARKVVDLIGMGLKRGAVNQNVELAKGFIGFINRNFVERQFFTSPEIRNQDSARVFNLKAALDFFRVFIQTGRCRLSTSSGKQHGYRAAKARICTHDHCAFVFELATALVDRLDELRCELHVA